MTTTEQAGSLVGSAAGLLSRESIIAEPGFNRWLVPPAALCILRRAQRLVWHRQGRAGRGRSLVLGLRRDPVGLGGMDHVGERAADFLKAG
jgi:hypothetical protein